MLCSGFECTQTAFSSEQLTFILVILSVVVFSMYIACSTINISCCFCCCFSSFMIIWLSAVAPAKAHSQCTVLCLIRVSEVSNLATVKSFKVVTYTEFIHRRHRRRSSACNATDKDRQDKSTKAVFFLFLRFVKRKCNVSFLTEQQHSNQICPHFRQKSLCPCRATKAKSNWESVSVSFSHPSSRDCCCCRDWNSWFPSVSAECWWILLHFHQYHHLGHHRNGCAVLSRCNQFISAVMVQSVMVVVHHHWSFVVRKRSNGPAITRAAAATAAATTRTNKVGQRSVVELLAHWHRFACLVTLDDNEEKTLCQLKHS